jgi:enoyl-CoA hydratase/carnithine racemase
MRADATLGTEEPFVLTTVANGVATLSLNRPQRFNPLSSQMIAAMQAELNAIASNTSVRVVILAAEGKGFCAGHANRSVKLPAFTRSTGAKRNPSTLRRSAP